MINAEKKQYHLYFQRIQVGNAVENPYFQLPGGCAFLLRRFHLIQPDYVMVGAPPTALIFPRVAVEMLDGTGAIRWQLQAVPSELYSAPRVDGVTVKVEPAPADASGFGINMSAVFKPRAQTLNLFYDVGENIKIRLSNMVNVAGYGYAPNFIDLAFEGYLIQS